MISKKIITGYLIMVLVLQLIPIKQVIEYFFIKNTLTEELVDCGKGPTKNFRLLDEDHKVMPDLDHLLPHLVFEKTSLSFHYSEMLPASHAADIQTPPPNVL